DEPDYESKGYTEPIPIDTTRTIKAVVFRSNSEEKLGRTYIQHINFHKAVGKAISIDKTPHKAYSGSGPEGLVNGISGSDTRYGDKEWLGFWGDDIEITIDFGEDTEFNSLTTRFHNGNGQWIYAPKGIDVRFVLYDGSIATDKWKLKNDGGDIIEFYYESPLIKKLNTKVKSVSLIIYNYGIIPKGKQGAGNKAWTFIDEIIIN
ncbi:MAG: chitobiase/beta-hexosaminidase C-terminal domain-containing protein, partial [Bacteroidota bacterium]